MADFVSTLVNVVADKIWTFERPVWFSGIRQRARTTILRLEDGNLLLHSAAPPTDAVSEQLRALGPVRWLIVPNSFHHLGTPAAARLFSEARVVGPASAAAKNRALKLNLDIHDAEFQRQVPELEALQLAGVPFLDETVLYHRPTQTLLGADIVLCANAKDHWSCRFAARVTGFYERVRVPPDVRWSKPDKAAAAQSLSAILKRPARRLIVGHADVIEEGCRDQLAQAWRLEGVDV
ncbi:MAG: DUF4336 domain-containing protein [Myxococcales bacterium]|nr:MAG: DUF4336 domain-containing protein [Myxococcales bacterium]